MSKSLDIYIFGSQFKKQLNTSKATSIYCINVYLYNINVCLMVLDSLT